MTEVREGLRVSANNGVHGAEYAGAFARLEGESSTLRPDRQHLAGARDVRCWPAVACCLCLVALLAFLPCARVFADDDGSSDDDGDNVVNEQQLPDSSFIYDTSIFSLSGADAYYDGQTVQVVGEVIGDVVNASLDGSYKWVTLFESDANTGETATISVYMTASAAESIDTLGAYGKTGTTLQVRGTFQLACSEHDGISDLHATSVTVVQKGSENPDEFNASAFVPGVVLVAVGLLLLFVFYRLRESRR